MKTLFLSLFFLLLSCKKTEIIKKIEPNDSLFATKLIENGYLNFAPSSKIDSLKIAFKKDFNTIYDPEIFRLTNIDAEELAEFSFDFFMPELNKVLSKRGITLSVEKPNKNFNSFEILINKEKLELYTQKELNNKTFWNTAPRNFFKQVNKLIKSKNCNEQFYLLYNDNDLQTILLTEKQFAIIADFYKDSDYQKPYKP